MSDQLNKRKRGRPKGSTSGRLLSPVALMSRAIKEQNINALLWSYITLAQSEIKENGSCYTFNGHNLNQFVSLLHQREVTQKLGEPDTTDIVEIQKWIAQACVCLGAYARPRGSPLRGKGFSNE